MNKPVWRVAYRITAVMLLMFVFPAGFPQNRPGTQNVTVELTARNFSFSEKQISVPRGAAVTIRFTNRDDGIPHNFSLYTDSGAGTVIFKGKVLPDTGRIEYTFTAPSEPGTYYFRCDIHPAQMNGSFIVTE